MFSFKQIVAVLLITSLSLSALSFGELPLLAVVEYKIDFQNSKQEHINQIPNTQTLHKLKLFENINVRLNDDETKNELLPIQNKIENHKTLSLNEFVGVTTNDSIENSIVLIKHYSAQQAIMERIFQQDKKRKNLDFKFIGFEILYPDLLSGKKFEKLLADNYFELTDTISNFVFLDQLLSYDFINEVFFTNNSELTSDKFVQTFSDDLVQQDKLLFNVEQLTFLILLLPIAGFVIVRSENEKISFSDVKPIFSFCFILILIFSVVTIPLSVSSAYWGVAFAQETEPELIDQEFSNKQKETKKQSNVTKKQKETKKQSNVTKQKTETVEQVETSSTQEQTGTVEQVETSSTQEQTETVEQVETSSTQEQTEINGTQSIQVNGTLSMPEVNSTLPKWMDDNSRNN